MLLHPLLINQWQSWLIVLAVVLLLFGATKLPALSKSLGQSIKIFRKEVKTDAASGDGVVDSTVEPTEKPSSASTDKS